jgi:hypothetical protein
MVRHAGETDGAKENRLMMAYLLEAILGHHATCLRVQLAAPVKVLPVESETEFARGRVKEREYLRARLLCQCRHRE